jgi:hypothetical protein
MSIQDCLELPDLLSKLPEVGYSIMNKGHNLKARAAHIQEQIKYLDGDLANLLEEVSFLWDDEERKEVGL